MRQRGLALETRAPDNLSKCTWECEELGARLIFPDLSCPPSSLVFAMGGEGPT